ncbi:hypothetical protein [Paludifilum halophilum]|uniref:Uncharacterized protein n=1 Tax=Paludifilum halophilum TaxID=1642702 RepID=A0A235B8N1_9BACL|nr:hypothetical protein [Paludifilum halophilum]OYD08339.1 hypothetical protein CHM34_05700 [Paludifilum halophilum]
MLKKRSLLQSMLDRFSLNQELANKPRGKRSVSVAKRGKGSQRCYGNRRSTCVWDRRGLKKHSH